MWDTTIEMQVTFSIDIFSIDYIQRWEREGLDSRDLDHHIYLPLCLPCHLSLYWQDSWSGRRPLRSKFETLPFPTPISPLSHFIPLSSSFLPLSAPLSTFIYFLSPVSRGRECSPVSLDRDSSVSLFLAPSRCLSLPPSRPHSHLPPSYGYY